MANKYGAKKVDYDGFTFDSQAEYRRYLWLKDEQAQGNIYGLGVHPPYELEPKVFIGGKLVREIIHVVDFSYFDSITRGLVVEDVKGVATGIWKLKYNLFRRRYPQIKYRVIPAKDC